MQTDEERRSNEWHENFIGRGSNSEHLEDICARFAELRLIWLAYTRMIARQCGLFIESAMIINSKQRVTSINSMEDEMPMAEEMITSERLEQARETRRNIIEANGSRCCRCWRKFDDDKLVVDPGMGKCFCGECWGIKK